MNLDATCDKIISTTSTHLIFVPTFILFSIPTHIIYWLLQLTRCGRTWFKMNLVQMRPKGHADRLVHKEAHLCTTNSLQTVLKRVDGTAANILLWQVVPTVDSTLREEIYRLRSRWQWCFAILAEWPLVSVAVLSANKHSKGIVDSPLYILKTSSRSARLRRSSNAHMPSFSSLFSYDKFLNPGTILVNMCWTHSSSDLYLTQYGDHIRYTVFQMGTNKCFI